MTTPGYDSGGQNISGQFGMPLYGIAGLLPFTGNYFWVDETNGSDGNTGGPSDALKTIGAAYAQCVSGNNDVVLLTGTAHVSATLVWGKDKTHLIGLAPNLLSQARARISQTGSTVFTPLVSVTGSECIWRDIGTFHGFADASTQIAVAITGGRNEFTRCLFGGMGNATAAAQAGGRSLTISGSTGENTFVDCQIGLDTITSSAANASLELLAATPRNVFRRCTFPRMTSSATTLMVKTTAAAAVDRFTIFDNCQFINAIQSTSTQMTVAFSMAASAGGMMLLHGCESIGSTKWGDAGALAQMYIDMPLPTTATGGLAIVPS